MVEQELTAQDIYSGTTYTIKEVAATLSVSHDAVLRWCLKGDVFPHAYRKGPMSRSAWLVPQVDLFAYMEKMTGLPAQSNDEEE